MDVTKHGGSAAGSLETEQRNMSEHDFFLKMEWFPRDFSRGLLPEKNPLIINLLNRQEAARTRRRIGLFRDGEFDPGSE